ncbi:MAG: hypothetical protein JNL58_17780 [Planctomyces sp.]|nr:hypothetical protein [Planctomyces sp.]
MRSFHRQLIASLSRILAGPWRFVQLRGTPLEQYVHRNLLPDEGDVDLFGTESSVTELLESISQWCDAGELHFLVERNGPDKTRLTLFSLDGCHRVQFDLWVRLRQFVGQSRVLDSSDCIQLRNQTVAVARFSLPVEFNLYIHHLKYKRRKLNSASVQQRLGAFLAQADKGEILDLTDRIQSILKTGELSDDLLTTSLHELRNQLPLHQPERSAKKLWSRISWAWHRPPRHHRFVFIAGCDGAGKTSLSQELVTRNPQIRTSMTGKHLYRKSLFYKFLVTFVRPLMFSSRERFDEIMAPVAYTLASLRLRVSSWIPKSKQTLIDRCLVDFLITDRKTDTPRLAHCGWLMQWIGIRYLVVHLRVPEERLRERKVEMTSAGLPRWNKLLYATLMSIGPVRYLGFFNGGTPGESATALENILPK